MKRLVGAACAASAIALLIAAAPSSAGAPGPSADPFVPLVVDLHVDQPWQVHYKERGPELSEGHTSVDALKSGGYGGMVFVIYLPDKPPKRPKGSTSTLADAEAILDDVRTITRKARVFLPIRSPVSLDRRVASFLAIEGAGPFAAEPARMDRFIERGVRLVGLVHANDNALGTSATGKDKLTGLTDAGKAMARRIYAAGALVDVSHLSDKGFDDLVPIAKEAGAPIVATHSNARRKAKHARNLTDAQLKTIAATGGVVGVNFYSEFVSDSPDPTLADVVIHVEHMVKIMGADHVAIGSDFDGMNTPAKGLEDASKLPDLAARLAQRGLSRPDLVKIFATNALRVLAWRPTRVIEARIEAAKQGPVKLPDLAPDEGPASDGAEPGRAGAAPSGPCD